MIHDDPLASPMAQAFVRLLRPLVRLLIARGVPYAMAAEALKRAYIAAAQHHFPDQASSGSQLSLLTGLNRKEVRRLTETHTPPAPAVISHAASVYQAWRLMPTWQDAHGRPQRLARHGEQSFDALVRSVTQDHRPSALLDELVRLGYVEWAEEQTLLLVDQAFLSQTSFDDRLTPLVESLEDHAQTAVSNVLGAAPPLLERSLFADELSPQSAQVLHARAREEWLRIHDVLINEGNAAESRDASVPALCQTRIRIGMYVTIDPPPVTPSDQESPHD
jgi:Family of unknown function (DUF6502)